ncbi:hypothetical protein [Mucilaginibacter rubeus]|uniref:Uncharacterized protein n=1 Tax=Mucilaginibacter rubeus TaxID=2027860 RepID=A0A5C1HWG3_9SPHI|nr:hypothetical protein [Mucilaginibacter rubeus]QEM10187.1 hypothetical protein DEO27_009170 [Mucilaginibacter rubeus]
MATLSEYGGIKPSIITYQPYTQTIETISGLLLLYPIVEQEYIRDGIIFHFFKKNFWGKKQLGYLKMEFIPGNHTDTSLKVDHDGNILPPYTDIVIGVEYGSEFKSVHWTDEHQIYNLESPAKQVLSLGFLFSNINVKIDAINKVRFEELEARVDFLSLNMTRLAFGEKRVDLLQRVKGMFNVFDKFLNRSDYQPIENEQQ